MKLPNKLYSYSESVISKFPVVLSILRKEGSLTILQLYDKVNRKIGNIDEFIETLDCLYLLGKIEYDYESRRIYYVE
ncbi:MAG: ABC-three component system middle component 7 [Clostridium sp.]